MFNQSHFFDELEQQPAIQRDVESMKCIEAIKNCSNEIKQNPNMEMSALSKKGATCSRYYEALQERVKANKVPLKILTVCLIHILNWRV